MILRYVLKRPVGGGGVLQKQENSCKMWLQRNILGWQVCYGHLAH